MTKEHWDNFEEYEEYAKLDEMPKRVVIRKGIGRDGRPKQKEKTEVKRDNEKV